MYGVGRGPRKKFVRRINASSIHIPEVKFRKKSELPEIVRIVEGLSKPKLWGLSRMSRKLGFSSGTALTRNLMTRDLRISMLMALSEMLGTNLLEHYRMMLPETIRDTPVEAALKAEMEELKKELAAVKTERDKYWEAIAKKI